MRNISGLSVFVCLSLVPAPCDAGGFFRRVPEVGEWASYEITMDTNSDPGKPENVSQRCPGTLVVKCVGEEVIDEQRCLWIETSIEMKPFPETEFNTIVKVLVPEDALLQNTLNNTFIRGWQSHMKGEPDELTFPSDDLSVEAAARTARMSSRTIVVNEEEIELTYSEHTTLPAREDEGGDILNEEMTIWPHEDLAFGVASMDVVSRKLRLGNSASESLTESRYDLVETGTDAVSELPDHN